MSEIAKIIGILIAIPGFIIALLILAVGWWTEGAVIDALLEVFNANPVLIGLISVLGFLALFIAIFSLIKSSL